MKFLHREMGGSKLRISPSGRSFRKHALTLKMSTIIYWQSQPLLCTYRVIPAGIAHTFFLVR